jgi:hypothetical protein
MGAAAHDGRAPAGLVGKLRWHVRPDGLGPARCPADDSAPRGLAPPSACAAAASRETRHGAPAAAGRGRAGLRASDPVPRGHVRVIARRRGAGDGRLNRPERYYITSTEHVVVVGAPFLGRFSSQKIL